MRAIVVGASGQIGGWLSHWLSERGHEVVGTYAGVAYPGLVRLDAAELDAARHWLIDRKPDVVFYPAGFTWVDGCEKEPAKAHAANVEQPLNLAAATISHGGRFVYFSTDYVFDGTEGPYDENAPTNPLSAYGRAKREAETALTALSPDRVLTVRTSWVFGPERQGKNFAYQLVRTLRQGKTLECPSDQRSNPSYSPDVARATVDLVEQGASGLIHVVGPEVIDRVAFARAIARAFDLDPTLIVGKTTSELGQTAPRPTRGGLLRARLDALETSSVRPLTEALADFRSRLEPTAAWSNPLGAS